MEYLRLTAGLLLLTYLRKIWPGIVLVVVVFGLISAEEWAKLPDGKLRLVVCDVGQGDAIFLRTPRGEDILVDGGPDESVLSCLSHQMPFFDRTIEMVFVSHPQADHLAGLIPVLRRYRIERLFLGPEGAESELWRQFKSQLLSHSDTKIANLYQGDRLVTPDGVEFELIWPEKTVIGANLQSGSGERVPVGRVVEGVTGPQVLGEKTARNLNEFSLVIGVNYGDFSAVLMGDADSPVQENIPLPTKKATILKVPHHGSKTALRGDLLQAFSPQLSLISVGRNNKFGHPTRNTLDQIAQSGSKILRTDQDGEISIESDGRSWALVSPAGR